MNAVVEVENTEMIIREYKGQRVVTFKDIDTVHQRPKGTAKRNFNRNQNILYLEKIILELPGKMSVRNSYGHMDFQTMHQTDFCLPKMVI